MQKSWDHDNGDVISCIMLIADSLAKENEVMVVI
jgi:hypothetical protein